MMEAGTSVATQETPTVPFSPKSRRRRWIVSSAFVAFAAVFFWQLAHHAMRPATITLPDGTKVELLGGFTGRRSAWRDTRPMLTVSYDITINEESFERTCKDHWNHLRARLPSWLASGLKEFPAAKPRSYSTLKPQALVLAANRKVDFDQWSITLKEDSGLDVVVFNASPHPKGGTGAHTTPLRFLQGEFPSDSKNLHVRFEFRGVKPREPDGKPVDYPAPEITIANPFYGHRATVSSSVPHKGVLGPQRIVAEHYRLSAPRKNIFQEVTFRIRSEPWRDTDDGVLIWDGTVCNAAGGWDVMMIDDTRRLPGEQAQEIVCRVSGWPSSAPMRVRFWLSPRHGGSRPPAASWEFRRVMVPLPGLGKPHGEVATSGDVFAKLTSVQNRSEGQVFFKVMDWSVPSPRECTSWYLRDSEGRTAHPETGADYRAWEAANEAQSSNRITFATNLPTHIAWFDVGLTSVVPEMVELEFPPLAKP